MINNLGLCNTLTSRLDGTVTTASHLDYQNRTVVSMDDPTTKGSYVWGWPESRDSEGTLHVFDECCNEGTELVNGVVTCSEHLSAVLTVELLDGRCLVTSA